MAQTANYGIDLLDEGQQEKEATINDGFNKLDSETIVPTYTVGTLPSVGAGGGVIYVSDATPAASMCFSNGTNWIDVLTGATVA